MVRDLQYDAVAVGEILVDFVVDGMNSAGYPVLSAYPGGAPANYLAALAGFGMNTLMVAKTGDDAFARLLLRSLKERGIETGRIVCDSRYFTTLAFVTLNQDGDREFSFARKPGADMCLRPDEVNLRVIDRAKSIYFGTTSLTADPMRQTVRQVVAYAKERGTMVVFDPNLRKPLWDDLDRAREEMLWGLSQADVVKLGEDEAKFLFGDGVERAAGIMHERHGVGLVFITLGERGCYFSSHSASGYVEGLRGIQVIDTTGAGDIFVGTAMSKILKSGRRLSKLREQELYEIVEFACASAGLSAAKPGGMTSLCSLTEVETTVKNFYKNKKKPISEEDLT